MDKKVSIITPCFNGEEFVGRYIESILNQTYKNIELILVNDGSTDGTEDIIKSYIPKFNNKGMELKYIYQKNKGQASALNKGLEIFNGDYLTWPDSDDILVRDSIEKKVLFLENNKQYGLVRTDAIIVNENNLNKIEGYFAKTNNNKLKEELFLDFINENKIWFAPGCYMIRTNAFLDVNHNRKIYESRSGQNWQMLLPITYKYKCGFIDEALYIYVVRENSHSHSIVDYKKLLNRCDEHEDILVNVVKGINMKENEKEKYLIIIKEKYIRKKLYIASKFRDKDLANKQYKMLKDKRVVNGCDFSSYLASKNKIYNVIFRAIRKIKRCITLCLIY
ncbi:glycosyltransferase family 2 protein [Clostridium botulinum]|nr:glycosyltransferase family 2 protein [Clostridium botulinum]